MTRLKTAFLLAMALLVSACAQLPSTGEPTQAAAAVTSPAPAPEVPPVAAPPEAQAAVNPVPAPPKDLWERIRRGFAMQNLDNPLVHEWEAWYSSRPDYVARMVDRSSRILYHVVEEVERRKMPTEIALLPMIESAYNPQAHSHSHASGIWQFIPSTGRLYGLRQNWWYDGRRDIIAATNAALDYLQKLHDQFGNWDLALASYNWGEGAVSRAIAKNEAKGLPTDYESLTLPAETRNYVPKLQAVKNIIADPARFGLTLADIPNEPYFSTVTINRHIDVKLAAKFAGISLEEFRFLNPAHNKRVINANTAETIVLPKRSVESFLAQIRNHDKPLVSWQAHTVKRGERPEKIAARYGMSLAELKEINGITGRARIHTGQPLLVPVKAGVEPNLPDLPAPAIIAARIKKVRYVPASRHGKAAHKASSHKTKYKKRIVKTRVAHKSTRRVKVTLRAKSASKKITLAENQKPSRR